MSPVRTERLVFRVLAACLDIRAVWSIDHVAGDLRAGSASHTLLAFAEAATLTRLRACEYLHSEECEFLVVVDGDAFASAWGPSARTGSLARWEWRQTSAHEAHYDEARWGEDDRTVIRVRRKALLVWPRSDRGSSSLMPESSTPPRQRVYKD